jgi:hypothetical protein
MKRPGRMRPTAHVGNHRAKASGSPMPAGKVASPGGGSAAPLNVTGKPTMPKNLVMKTPTLETLSTDRGAFKIK